MTRRCPCFLHYHPPREWRHLKCACECAHEPTESLRDQIAVDLHKLFCDMRCDDEDSPCWTAWRQEADLLMIPIEVALALAWEDGARNGSRGLLSGTERKERNPYLRGGA